jgi:hypothetical protein
MLESHAPPGQPFIIRWQTPNEAIVATADDSPIAHLIMIPGGEPEVRLLTEPATFEERALLCSALAWAVIENVRGGTRPLSDPQAP